MVKVKFNDCLFLLDVSALTPQEIVYLNPLFSPLPFCERPGDVYKIKKNCT